MTETELSIRILALFERGCRDDSLAHGTGATATVLLEYPHTHTHTHTHTTHERTVVVFFVFVQMILPHRVSVDEAALPRSSLGGERGTAASMDYSGL